MNLMDLTNSLIPSVLKAGKIIMEIYQGEITKEIKTDGSPVTDADKAAEKIILRELNRLVPEILVVSEEAPESHSKVSKEKFFLVDPLDGTKEFLKKDGKGSFTVNIGLIENYIPIMGIVYAPALGRLFFGAQTFGAWEVFNGLKTKLSIGELKTNNVVAVASVSHRDQQTDTWLKENKISKTTSIGSSLKFCLVAAGQADVYPRFGPTMEWDTAAGDAILRAAGGKITNPDLSNFNYGKNLYRNGPFIAWGSYNGRVVIK